MICPKFTLISSPRVNYKFAPRWSLFVDRMLRKLDDFVLTESVAGKNTLIETQGYFETKIDVVRNSVDSVKYTFDKLGRDSVRKELGIETNDLVVGSLGRLHNQKGYDVFIEALSHLKNSPVRFRTLIAGEGPDLEDLQLKADSLNVQVSFLGKRNDVTSVLSAMDIYVQSSRYEGLSNALLQAMSVGLPCVATGVDGTRDIAKDGENILLVKPSNALSLSVGIGLLLEKPGLREKLKFNAKITASQFTVDQMVSGFEQAYLNVTTRKI